MGSLRAELGKNAVVVASDAASLVDIAALVVLGGGAYIAADWALARKEPLEALRRDNIARHLRDRLARTMRS